MDTDHTVPSTKPYVLRALHEWCTDHHLTPYLAVAVDGSVQVPMEFVQDGQIVLNVSYDATSQLVIGQDVVDFKARFGGASREVVVPISHVLAIYARENGQGMAFPAPAALDGLGVDAPAASAEAESMAPRAQELPIRSTPKRPTLTRVK